MVLDGWNSATVGSGVGLTKGNPQAPEAGALGAALC